MPRLIHLNGPPGIGKSTLAQMYVDRRPGVLNLDIDQLRRLIGGSDDRFAETGELVRPLALSMAGTHLRAGRDVVLPQYLGRVGQAELPWHRLAGEVVDRNGGLSLLADMYDQLLDVLRRRPSARVVRSDPGGIEQTYEALVAVLDDSPSASSPGDR